MEERPMIQEMQIKTQKQNYTCLFKLLSYMSNRHKYAGTTKDYFSDMETA
jgi:hypothetical protein